MDSSAAGRKRPNAHSFASVPLTEGGESMVGQIFNAHPLDCLDDARPEILLNGRAKVGNSTFLATSNSCRHGLKISPAPLFLRGDEMQKQRLDSRYKHSGMTEVWCPHHLTYLGHRRPNAHSFDSI